MAFILALVMLLDTQFWIGQLDLERAWTLSKGSGVIVAVVDTGVNADHPDLAGATLPGAEFPELGTGTQDPRGHGTDMAVLIAGRGSHTFGVAPEAMILPVKLSGNGDDANAAVKWATDHGARVLNLSLGGSATGRYDEGLRYAEEHDVVVVAAAGNAGIDEGVSAPANGPGVLAVSAVDRNGEFRPDISVEGPEVVISAPGKEITTLRGSGNGTSQAAAIVSGTAALVRARYPDMTAREVVELLTSTAKDAGPQGRDPRYGFGIVDPLRALTTGPKETNHVKWWLLLAVGVLLTATAGVVMRKKASKIHRTTGG